MNQFYIYDFENYQNFSCVIITRNTDLATWYFEISEWRNDGIALNQFLHQVAMSGGRMVGYNNVGYDYPVTHTLMQYGGRVSPALLFNRGQSIIQCENRWENVVWERDRFVPQVDLYLIHHFDNKAKQTSLKLLEFNMRMDDIQELPYPVDRPLTWEESRNVATYNQHDVKATLEFFKHTLEDIEFRDELSKQYGKDFTNHNDTKIGADIVKIELEKRGVRVHKSIQSIRDRIVLDDIIFPYIRFETPELQKVLEFFRTVVMSPDNLNGFFNKYDNETSATLHGFTFDFGAGGIHGSVENTVFHSDDEYVIVDIDYGSFYPNIAIKNNLYPEHLGSGWCVVMDHMYHERLRIGKKTKIGKAYKLALNGSYGKSNDIHSPFYDPQYTMQITINGQLILCMLSELLMTKIPGLQMIFVNTDGLCCRIPRFYEQYLHDLCAWSDAQTGLELEFQNYKMIAVKDVNNYIGVIDDGGIKRKGAYNYDLGWHQNHSAIVVAKAAEAHMVYGRDIRQFITEHVNVDPHDFMLRAKAPRAARVLASRSNEKRVTQYVENIDSVELHGDEYVVPNITRYYASTDGVYLTKLMKPTVKQVENWRTVPHWYHVDTGAHKCAKKAPSGKWTEGSAPSNMPPLRRIGIESGQRVKVCNTLTSDDSALVGVDIDYYVKEAEKLVIK